MKEIDVPTSARPPTHPRSTRVVNRIDAANLRASKSPLTARTAAPRAALTEEVRRRSRADAPAARRRTMRADESGLVSRVQYYLRIPRC